MDGFIKLISSDAFLDFLSTYGLAVVIVVYFVFFRDPKRYNKLQDNYDKLKEDLAKIVTSLQPEKREMSPAQTTKLCHLALDRDLYKLHCLLSKKVENKDPVSVSNIIKDTIFDTNISWSTFKSPFMKVPSITDLYGVYSGDGDVLRKELEDIISLDGTSEEDKKEQIWNKLLENTV